MQLQLQRASVALLGGLAALTLCAGSAQATFVGDLVYCDENANGVFDDGDRPLDGVGVQIVCSDSAGATCADFQTTTGGLHSSAIDSLSFFDGFCGELADYDPQNPNADLSGRYLFEVWVSCQNLAMPWSCSVQVDETTLPESCDRIVTPSEDGFPVDANADGDLCDAGDGPFPEGQVLGNKPSLGGCEAFPDPLPSTGNYITIVSPEDDSCSIHNDFGYTHEDEPGGATRTPGGWKNRPRAVEMFLPVEFCGNTVDDVCNAVALLGRRGGGLGKWARHATAAQLNCNAFGCPADIAELIAEGNAACAAGNAFPFNGAGSVLDAFNNSGVDIEVDFWRGSADPHFCAAEPEIADADGARCKRHGKKGHRHSRRRNGKP